MKRSFSSLALVTASLLFAASAAAVGTRRFTLDKEADFKGGDLKGVAVDSHGAVRAGLDLGAVPVSEAQSIWCALPQKDGSVLLGTGNEGKLLQVKGGAVTVAAETNALVITSLVNGWGGSVLAGTLPEGKIMKWDRGKLTELTTLAGAKHVFGLAFDARNNALYAATGPEGKLFRITQGGEAQVFFDAEEQHLISVAVAPDGSVLAGASDKAKLYKVTGPGRASVLYDFNRTEVRGIAVGPKGDVYAIANDLKNGFTVPAKPSRNQESTPAGPTAVGPKPKGKGTLYHFTPDGQPDRLYDNDEEHFTSIGLGDDGRAYVGTGAEGRVYAVDGNQRVALVADTDERQVGAVVLAGATRFVTSSDPAVLHPLKGVGGPDAVWTGKVLDAGLRARFGRMSWESTGAVQISTRTGNTKEPDGTWSPWSADANRAGPVASPTGRYFQVRARFPNDPNAELSEFEVAFVTDNLRATVDDVNARPRRDSNDDLKPSGGPVSRKAETKLAISWKIDNPDKDEMRYRLQYRLVGTTTWYDLTRRDEVVTKETYDWDTSTLPEGRYRVRVSASDELSNPPDRVTRDDAESGIVLVDNTPPRLENLRATGRRVQGTALDGVGPIQRIDVALAGRDEWVPFYPKDGIFDEAREEFDFDATVLSAQGPAILAVRVYDDANNFVIQNVQLK
ncbi:MAG TPA: hypothetical protein VFV94_12400 [Polyangiaceae bacterium]|nr:hypothetical protein [Polyangiaceae bacterium]